MQNYRTILVADHHKSVFVCQVLDRETGEITHHKLASERRVLKSFFRRLARPAQVLIEACRSWEWVSDLCEDLGIDFQLVDPARMPEIARSRKKTDRHDVEAMVERLLTRGVLPASYRATREERALRALTRRLGTLRNLRRRTLLRIHALIDGFGMPASKKRFVQPDWREEMQEVLPFDLALALESLLMELDKCLEWTRRLEVRTKELVTPREDFQRIVEIPGVGPIVGATILAESAGIQRFPTARQFASFTGLVPRVRSSADKARIGHITRNGPPDLRWALGQAAIVSLRASKPTAMKDFYKRKTRKGKPAKLIACASAHKLARIVYVLLAREETYRPPKCAVA